MATKHDWRYAPRTVMTIRNGSRPVVSYTSYPPGAHPPGTPITPTVTALAMLTDRGETGWVGVDEAVINAELRMIVRGGYINPRNELARSWRKVPRKLVPPRP